MKRTPFYHFHEQMGAKLVPFAGYEMPVEYSGINVEHVAVRTGVGVFDVSHMGEVWVTGERAEEFLQYITSNDVELLVDGKVQYSCFPNGRGGIVDDLLVYRLGKSTYLLVINAANIEKDWNWILSQGKHFGLTEGAGLENASGQTAQLAVQGPLALEAMQELTSESITGMEYYSSKVLQFAGIKEVILSTTGYTGAGGCEIYVPNADAETLWNAVFEAGNPYGIKPIGLGARDTLRLEMGYCLYGNDITDDTSPIEAGLGWITKIRDGKKFIDKDRLLQQKSEGVTRRLKGFVMKERGIPRQHYPILDDQGNRIGEVTSGTMSPMMKQGIGMGYLDRNHWKEGSEVFIEIRNKSLKAEVVKFPIYKG